MNKAAKVFKLNIDLPGEAWWYYLIYEGQVMKSALSLDELRVWADLHGYKIVKMKCL